MFKRKTFHTEIRAILIVFSVFGLWPSWPSSKYRRLHTLYSLLSIVLVVAVSVSALSILDIFDNSTLSVAVAYSFVLNALCAHLITMCQAFYHRDEQQRLIAKFAHVDQLLQRQLHVNISYRAERRHILARTLAIGGLLLAIKMAVILHLYYREAFAVDVWIHCLYSVFILRLRCVQILVFVLLLRSRINLINGKVKEILLADNRHKLPASMRWTTAAGDRDGIFLLDVSAKLHSTYDRLMRIKHIYGELYEICEWMNTTFGWSLLAIVTQCFIDFTSVRWVWRGKATQFVRIICPELLLFEAVHR